MRTLSISNRHARNAGKAGKKVLRTEKRKRKMKKDAAATGNPVKAGYIKYDMSGLFASKHPVLTAGARKVFTKNVKAKTMLNIFCKTSDSASA